MKRVGISLEDSEGRNFSMDKFGDGGVMLYGADDSEVLFFKDEKELEIFVNHVKDLLKDE